MLHVITGCSRAEGDEKRRALGDPDGQAETREWFYRRARMRGYDLPTIERIWDVLRAFASFGFCKAHAAAFALPTYQSAWLKAHHTASFLAGVLTHDPGMYPKRLILDDARQFGITVLPARRQRISARLPASNGSRCSTPQMPLRRHLARSPLPSSAISRARGVLDHPALPDATRVRHPNRAGRGQGHQRRRGRPDRCRTAVSLTRRLLAPGRSLASGRRTAGARRGFRRAARHRPHPSDSIGASSDHSPRPAAAGRRARPLDRNADRTSSQVRH